MNPKEENTELAKWLAGELSEAELSDFEQTPEYATYVKIAAHSTQLKAPDFDADLLYQKIKALKENKSKVIAFLPSRWMKIAAVFLALIGLYFVFNTASATTQIAGNGKKSSFSLPDNSEVVLNSGSNIHYKKWNWDNNRKLELEGEAYFKVAHGKKFEVVTKTGTVSVLGTQFNVKSREGRFDVSCYKGKVKVSYNGREVIITKGISVSFDKDYFDLKNISATQPEWTQNQIVFTKEKLSHIVEELQRQYNCEIELKCKENNQLFSGTLPSDNRKTAVAIIASIFHLKISEIPNGKIVLEDI